MDKIFKLREWLTLDEAARYLSRSLDEPATVADVLHLALSRRLKLSVHFVNPHAARYGHLVAECEAGMLLACSELGAMPIKIPVSGRAAQEAWVEQNKQYLDGHNYVAVVGGYPVPGTQQVVELSDKRATLEGVWDLPMIGGERLDVEHALQAEIHGPEVTTETFDGAFVVSEGGNIYAQILEHMSKNPYHDKRERLSWDDPNNFYPAGGLPSDMNLVVRPAAISEFVTSLSDASTGAANKPVDTRERTTLLCIIGALARHARLDLAHPMKAGDTIEAMVPDLKLSGRTIGEHLKKVAEAMTDRKV